MAPVFHRSSIDVDNRLQKLGWTRAELLEIVDAMVTARNGCTANDPLGAAGWMSYKEGTRRLRELALPKGLVRSDEEQIPWALDLGRRVRFAVSNTDDGTALEHAVPQNRSKKGPSTDRVVSGNCSQSDLFETAAAVVVPLSSAPPQPGIVVSWYLCVYVEGDEVRAELSCPIGVQSGYFTAFMERIPLIGPDDGSIEPSKDEDDGSEYDIPVSKK